MVSIDAMFAELRDRPAGERTEWDVLYALSRLDPAPEPPSGPPPAWFAKVVAGSTARLATRRMQMPVFSGSAAWSGSAS
jgi:hypothetical protein